MKCEDLEFDWGMIVNYKNRENFDKDNPLKSSSRLILVDILLHLDENYKEPDIRPCPKNARGSCEVVPVLHTLITHISSIRLKTPNDLRSADAKRSIIKTIQVNFLKYKMF